MVSRQDLVLSTANAKSKLLIQQSVWRGWSLEEVTASAQILRKRQPRGCAHRSSADSRL